MKHINTFLYFSYGSNMLSFRMSMSNIFAEYVSIGRLDNYHLDFIRYSKFWGGPTATAVATANAHIWGVVWCMHEDNIAALDEQEGVEKNIYYPKYVKVLTPHLGAFPCRMYIQEISPLPIGDNDEIPIERWPSWTYKKALILGAIEHQLPQFYLQSLKKIKHNGEKGCFKMYSYLLRYVKEKQCQCLLPQKIKKPPKLDLRKLRRQKQSS